MNHAEVRIVPNAFSIWPVAGSIKQRFKAAIDELHLTQLKVEEGKDNKKTV